MHMDMLYFIDLTIRLCGISLPYTTVNTLTLLYFFPRHSSYLYRSYIFGTHARSFVLHQSRGLERNCVPVPITVHFQLSGVLGSFFAHIRGDVDVQSSRPLPRCSALTHRYTWDAQLIICPPFASYVFMCDVSCRVPDANRAHWTVNSRLGLPGHSHYTLSLIHYLIT